MHIIGTPEYYRARVKAFAIIKALEDAIGAWEDANSNNEYAYSDTAYENFDGDYDEFVADRSADCARAERRMHLTCLVARRNGYVMETLRAQNRHHLLRWIQGDLEQHAA